MVPRKRVSSNGCEEMYCCLSGLWSWFAFRALAAASTMMGPHLAQPSPHREKKQETANWFWGVRRIGGGGGGGGGGSGHGRVATEGLVSRPAPVAS